MRKSHVLLAALIALAVVGIWLWPTSDTSRQETDTQASSASGLEERREARRNGTISSDMASLSGVVIHKADRSPIALALVSLRPRKMDGGLVSRAGQSPAPIVRRTDATGRFQIDGLSAGSYSLSASADGYIPMALDAVMLESGTSRSDLLFALRQGGRALRGTVSDIGGGPVASAQVRATLVSEFTIGTLFRAPFTATTNDKGDYELHLGDGRYRVSVFHEDYRRTEETVIIGGADRNADFVLTPGSMIEGIVLKRSDDSPVANALVTARPAGQGGGFTMSGIAFGGGAQTDEDGRFSLRGLGNGAFDLQAVAKHASSVQLTQVELGIAESLSDVIVYVDDAFTLSGFVVRDDGEETQEPGVLVGAYNLSPGAVFASATPSASDGYFEIHGVHPGTYTLGAAGEERQPTFFGDTITVTNEDIGDLLVKVKSGFTLTGHVTPPQEAQIHLEVDMEDMGFSKMLQVAGSFLVNGRSDAKGEFMLRGVGRGEYTLIAKTEAGSKAKLVIDVSDDMNDLALVLEERASASGIVVDAAGHPVEGVTVEVVAEGKPTMTAFNMMRPGVATMTGPDGRFVHLGLEDGDFGITVHENNTQLPWAGKEDEAALTPTHIEIKDGVSVRDLRLIVVSRNLTIGGSVLSATGTPLADAWVTAKLQTEQDRSRRRWSRGEDPVLTDVSGHFEITGLREGSYDLVAEGMRGEARGKAEEVKAGSNVTITVEALGGIHGRVSRAGEPVTNYVIAAIGPTRRRAHIVASDGKFELQRLEAGEYTIEVTSDVGTATMTTSLKSGEQSKATITLAAFGSISGTLVDVMTGDPIAGISVAASTGEGGGRWAENALDMMQGKGPMTDDDGRFTVGKLGAGEGNVAFMDPAAKGFGMVARKEFQIAAGESVDLGTIQGRRPVRIDKEKRGTLGLVMDVGTADEHCSESKPAQGLPEASEHLWVTGVEKDGPAERSGVKRCDRITSAQGIAAEQAGPEGLRLILNDVELGKTITLGLITASGSTTVSIEPAPIPED